MGIIISIKHLSPTSALRSPQRKSATGSLHILISVLNIHKLLQACNIPKHHGVILKYYEVGPSVFP